MGTTSGEVVRSVLAAATSSFVPVSRDDVHQGTSPFVEQALGGYGTYLAEIDPDRLWLSMLRPGAQGYGLLVAFFNPHLCCDPQGPYRALQDTDEVPLLFPAVVQWASVIDPATNRVATSVAKGWDEDLDFPPVGITSDWWLDATVDRGLMAWANLIHHVDAMPGETAENIESLDEVFTGLAAPWQLVPITQEAFTLARDFLAQRELALDTHVMGLTSCELLSGEDEWLMDDHSDPDNPGQIPCAYSLGDGECACGQQPTAFQLFDALMVPLGERALDSADLFVPDKLHPLWRLALRNYAIGWLAVAARVREGDIWSTWCWRRLSPFLGSHSLEALLRRLSEPSTSSAMRQASFLVSSPQLTLFDSSPTGS